MPANLEDADFCIRQPATFEARCAAARLMAPKLGLTIPTLVDGMDDAAARAFSAWPERIYVVHRDGRVAHAGAPGPWGFKPEEAEQALHHLLGPPSNRNAALHRRRTRLHPAPDR